MTKSRCKHWQGLSNSEAQTHGQTHLWVVDFICPPKFHRNFNCTKGIKFLLDTQHMDGNWNVQLSTTWKNYDDNATHTPSPGDVLFGQYPRHTLQIPNCSVRPSWFYRKQWKMSTVPRLGSTTMALVNRHVM